MMQCMVVIRFSVLQLDFFSLIGNNPPELHLTIFYDVIKFCSLYEITICSYSFFLSVCDICHLQKFECSS